MATKATASDSTAAPKAAVRNTTPELTLPEQHAARYWAEGATGAGTEIIHAASAASCCTILPADAEVQLELALGMLLLFHDIHSEIDQTVALLMTSALLTLRRARLVERLAAEAHNV